MATYRASAAGGGTTGTSDRTATLATPAVGDYLLVFCNASVNTNLAPTCSDNNGGSYELIDTVRWNASANTGSVFRRTTPVPNTTSTTVTVATGSNDAGEIAIVAIQNMIRFDASSVRSTGKEENGAAAGTAAPALNQAALTTNVTIAVLFSGDTTTTPPTSWTERQEVSQATPTTAVEVATRDSGFTGTTITFGASTSTVYGAFCIELDGSDVSYAGDYPASAAEMASALGGYGTWLYGYPMNEASGDLVAEFGTLAWDDNGSGPTYSVQGAISASHAITLGNNIEFKPGATASDTAALATAGTDDLIIALLVKPVGAGNSMFCRKGGTTSTTTGWNLTLDLTAKTAVFQVTGGDAYDTATCSLTMVPSGAWYIVIAVLERATDKIRVGVCVGGNVAVSSETATTASESYSTTTVATLRGSNAGAGTGFTVDHAWFAKASGAATGLSSNLSTALSNLYTTLLTGLPQNGAGLLLLGVG